MQQVLLRPDINLKTTQNQPHKIKHVGLILNLTKLKLPGPIHPLRCELCTDDVFCCSAHRLTRGKHQLDEPLLKAPLHQGLPPGEAAGMVGSHTTHQGGNKLGANTLGLVGTAGGWTRAKKRHHRSKKEKGQLAEDLDLLCACLLEIKK